MQVKRQGISERQSDARRIGVILPAYNEEATIADTIRAFAEVLPDAMFCIVDNNSTDATAACALDALREAGLQGQVIHEARQGKGHALRRAFHAMSTDVILLADADMTYPASRALDLLRPVLDDRADMVVGDRHSNGAYRQHNKRQLHGLGNRLVGFLVNFLFRADLRDVMSGYRAFSRTFVKTYPVLVQGFQVETDMTLHALDKRMRIVEIPIEYVDRPAGSHSKLNTLKDGAKVLFAIAQILRYYRPLLFFSGLSVLFMLIGFVAATPAINDWLHYRYVYHLPLAVLAAALEVVAVVTVGMGLMLDSVAHQQRMQFELLLLRHSSKAEHSDVP